MSKIHYAGPVADQHGSKGGGWAACCSGDRALSIENQGLNTRVVSKVTCATCLRKMRSHANYWSRPEFAGRESDGVDCFMDQFGPDPRMLGDELEDLGLWSRPRGES